MVAARVPNVDFQEQANKYSATNAGAAANETSDVDEGNPPANCILTGVASRRVP